MISCPLLERLEALENAQRPSGVTQTGALVLIRTFRDAAYSGLFGITTAHRGRDVGVQILAPHRLGAWFSYHPEELHLIGHIPPFYKPHKWAIPCNSLIKRAGQHIAEERIALHRFYAGELLQPDQVPPLDRRRSSPGHGPG